MKIALYPNCKKSGVIETVESLFSKKDSNIEIYIADQLKGNFAESSFEFGDISRADYCLSLGGDGTLIKAARIASTYGIPLLGVNFGHLGFLTQIQKDKLDETIVRLFRKDYTIEERMMLKGQVIKNGETVETYYSLNDIVVTRMAMSRIVCLDVKVDGLDFGNYFADGIILSTPTGSTGYSLSAGGPIIDPSIDLIIMTPICSHSMHSRSVVLSQNTQIEICPNYSYNKEIAVTWDGQITSELSKNTIVVISKAETATKFIKLEESNFYKLLTDKLTNR